jgi:signal transduction histidine kinase/FixJ family two-component response regulator
LLAWSAAKGDGDTLGLASPWMQEVTVGSGPSTWRLRVWPSPGEVEHQRSPLPQVTLAVGLLLGLLLALATHLARTAELRARALSVSHTRLEGEIAERERAEAALRSSEAQLQQSQKMEAIGRLAGGIAHDFNNLLTAISGYSEFLLSDLDQDDPHREDVSEIKKAAGRAATLTSQLLAFSRRQIRQPRSLDLNVVVADLEKMMSRLIGEDIAFTTRFAQSLPAVYADPSQIEQIVLNLVINASDAMPHGGTITVATARELDATTGGSFVSLSVSDTGHGMDATTRARVFEPFFTTKEQGRGTGLGLSTVWAVVEQSGGTVRVESEPGLGSTFTVRLPAYADAAGTYVSNMLVTDAPTGTERVLLAEDEESVRALAARILERHGYTVLQAKNGYEALAVAESAGGGIQLLLTDVVMPEMGGKRLADALLQQQPTARVLYMSGYTDGEISRRGELDPGTAFIQKPFTAAGLLAKVREVLDGLPSEELARRERLARAHATPMSTPAIRLAVVGASAGNDDTSGD